MGRNLRRVGGRLSLARADRRAAGVGVGALRRKARGARRARTWPREQQPDGSIPAFSPIGSTSDAVLAFVASGVGGKAMNKALGYLRAQTSAGNVNALGLRAKVVLALDAAGKDPTHFGGHDLVHEIRSTLGHDGRFGSDPVLDDALAVLALASTGTPLRGARVHLAAGRAVPGRRLGVRRAVRPRARRRALPQRRSDFFDSDSNTTGYVVMALVATGHTGVEREPVRVLRHAARPGQGRLELQRVVHRDRRELDLAGPAGLRRGRRARPVRRRWGPARAAAHGLRRVGVQLERRHAGRPRRRRHHRGHPGGAARPAPDRSRTGEEGRAGGAGVLDDGGQRARDAAEERRPRSGRRAGGAVAGARPGRHGRGGRLRRRRRPAARRAGGRHGRPRDVLLRGARRVVGQRHPSDRAGRAAVRAAVPAGVRRPGRVPAERRRPGRRRLLRRLPLVLGLLARQRGRRLVVGVHRRRLGARIRWRPRRVELGNGPVGRHARPAPRRALRPDLRAVVAVALSDADPSSEARRRRERRNGRIGERRRREPGGGGGWIERAALVSRGEGVPFARPRRALRRPHRPSRPRRSRRRPRARLPRHRPMGRAARPGERSWPEASSWSWWRPARSGPRGKERSARGTAVP